MCGPGNESLVKEVEGGGHVNCGGIMMEAASKRIYGIEWTEGKIWRIKEFS